MNYSHPDDVARQRALKRRRKSIATRLAYVFMVPPLLAFFVLWQKPTMAWLYGNGILPDYGVMQFIEGQPVVNWDQTLVAALAGAVFGLVGYMIATPIVRLFVR